MLWFSAVELIGDSDRELIPVDAVVDRLAGLDDAARTAWDRLTAARPPLQLGERTIRLDQPQVAGIVNLTPDSFSDGGRYADEEEALDAAHAMTAAGAAIVDLGGE